jgi:drug/metabolite transporter (DMT)-like permease
LYIILGAALWGTIGLYIDRLSEAGFTSLQIVTLRVVSASVLLVSYLLIKDRNKLNINWRDSLYFIGTGILSVVFFNWCYFTAIKEVSLSVAVVLLYTGPAFVALMSWFLFNEAMTIRKITALMLTLTGCILVVEVLPLNQQSASLYGVLVGLGAGFGYALYSIFGKYALKKYSSITIITYTFVFASLALIPFSNPVEIVWKLMDGKIMLTVLGLGLLPTVVAYLLYTYGLSIVESSSASITATVEPIVATLIGVFVFQEVLTLLQSIGILMVLSAVVLIQMKKNVRVPVS